jgi:glycine/D-amino acid oxidase-like deaminating enzyme
MTDDELFIVDRLPDHRNVIIAGGFSGTGFKFGPTIGKIVAQLLEGGRDAELRTRFKMDKLALTRVIAKGQKAKL